MRLAGLCATSLQDQIRTPMVKVWYLKHPFTLEKFEILLTVKHQNDSTSLSVAYLVSTSSMSWQVLEILSNLNCHEIRKGKLEERQRLIWSIKRRQARVRPYFVLVIGKLTSVFHHVWLVWINNHTLPGQWVLISVDGTSSVWTLFSFSTTSFSSS